MTGCRQGGWVLASPTGPPQGWSLGGAVHPAQPPQQPERVVQALNGLFSAFDRLAGRYGLERIKAIGDAYMVAGGLPEPRPDHARAVAEVALAMRDEVARHADPSGRPLQVRVGIDTGPVEAGMIGTSRFSYDLWGDTVNTASRMEPHGTPAASRSPIAPTGVSAMPTGSSGGDRSGTRDRRDHALAPPP